MQPLRIRLRRVSPTHHRFEAIRADGGVEVRELETRSLLLHDLVHFAVEAEARLEDSFYGRLARGGDYDASASIWDAEAGDTERVVAALQGAAQGDVDPDAFVARLRAYCGEIGVAAPGWLSAEVVAGALVRLHALRGRWNATPFGETLELAFPPADA
jgi:hypothetical protein